MGIAPFFISADRSHAPRGNAAEDALRPALIVVTRSVNGCIPTRSVGTIIYRRH